MNVAFFHSNLSLQNRQSLINSFQDMKENDSDFNILIETTEVLKTDYILHHVFWMILMKLNYMIWMKQQTFFESVDMIKLWRKREHINFILRNLMSRDLLKIIRRDVRSFKMIHMMIVKWKKWVMRRWERIIR